jgi:hypothetical protein
MNASPTCPDCRTEMERGFVPDHYATTIRSHWHPGAGDEKTFFGNLKLDSEKMIPIVAYRCPQCGALKLYATKSDA